MQILLDLSRADLRCAGQVYHLNALFLQEVKLTLPVVTHNEGINMILVNISALLLPVFLRDYQIHIPKCFQQFLTLLVCEIAFLLLFIPVELICRNRNDQIVAQGLGTAQNVDMTIVQQVKGAVGNDTLHSYSPCPKNSFLYSSAMNCQL